MSNKTNGARKINNVVLVHGGFVDGAGWEGVYTLLKKQGYNVAIAQNPTISLADDVAVTKRVIAAQNGPVILVGHSYGGAVISEAGNDPNVASLVYITAFAPDQNESVQTLIQNPAPGTPVPPILPPQDGFLLLDPAKFADSFAADVDPDMAAFMADSQVPWGLDALGGAVTEPAWRSKPTWYLVATDDRMIPPDAQTGNGGAGRRNGHRSQGEPCSVRLSTPGRCRLYRPRGKQLIPRNPRRLPERPGSKSCCPAVAAT